MNAPPNKPVLLTVAARPQQTGKPLDATYQRLELHFVVVLRDGQRLDRLNRSAVKFVQRQAGWEQGVYDGQRSALLFIEDVRVGDVIEASFVRWRSRRIRSSSTPVVEKHCPSGTRARRRSIMSSSASA
ncbi:MAG: DUF3857 domain-containing protein [Byssovorax sp.]